MKSIILISTVIFLMQSAYAQIKQAQTTSQKKTDVSKKVLNPKVKWVLPQYVDVSRTSFTSDGSKILVKDSYGITGYDINGVKLFENVFLKDISEEDRHEFQLHDITNDGNSAFVQWDKGWDKSRLTVYDQIGEQLFHQTSLYGGYSWVKFSSDGSKIVTYETCHFQVLDAKKGSTLLTIKDVCALDFFPHELTINLSKDGTKIAFWGSGPRKNYTYSSEYAELAIYDITSGEKLIEIPYDKRYFSIKNLKFSNDGTKIAYGDNFGLFMYDISQKKLLFENLETEDDGEFINFSPDGSMITAPMLYSDELIVFNMNGTELFRIPHLDIHDNGIFDLKINFSKDGTKLVSVNSDNELKIFDIDLKKLLVKKINYTGVGINPVQAELASISPDETKIIIYSTDKRLRLIELYSE